MNRYTSFCGEPLPRKQGPDSPGNSFTVSLEKAEAIVIRHVDFSESSRVITFFSREFGKFAALAKGAQSLKEDKKKSATEGKDTLERKLKQLKIDSSEANVLLLMNFYKVISPLDLYFNIASKKIDLGELSKLDVVGGKIKLPKPANLQNAESMDEVVKQTLQKNAELLIMGESSDKIDYKFAPCCNPIPGDDVFGFLTIQDGIKIHRTNCPNAVQLMSKYAYRIVKTRWTKEHEIAFLTGIKLTGIDDVGLVNKITNVITGQMNLNMRSLSFESTDGVFEGKIILYVHDTTELEDLLTRLNDLDGILDVSRFDSEDEKL